MEATNDSRRQQNHAAEASNRPKSRDLATNGNTPQQTGQTSHARGRRFETRRARSETPCKAATPARQQRRWRPRRQSTFRPQVREALARLRDERLVAIVPQLGTFVTLISPRTVADAEFVREALECAAIARAVSRIGHEELEEPQWNLAAQEQARVSGNERAFDRLDEELHRRLCDSSGHSIAWALSRRANGHLDRIRRLSLPDPGYLSEMLAEHGHIVAAVATGDASTAETALREHLRMVASSLPRLQELHPDYFE